MPLHFGSGPGPVPSCGPLRSQTPTVSSMKHKKNLIHIQNFSRSFLCVGYLLDTHTAVGLTIAERFNHSHDVPILVAGTAHFGKFAADVLQALNATQQAVDYSQLHPLQLMEELDKFQGRPHSHNGLVQSLNKPRIHERVVEANVNTVVGEIYDFLDSSS